MCYYYYSEGGLSSIIIQEDTKYNPLNEHESYFGSMTNKDYYENGQLRELKSKKQHTYAGTNKKEGLYQWYSSTGGLEKEGFYTNDKKNGVWNYYNYYGRLERKITYVLGDIIGPFEEYFYHHENKSKSKSYMGVHYEDSTTQIITYFYDDGNIKESGKYLRIYKGSLSGREGWWKSYYESGVLKEEGVYENGEKKGVWKLYSEKGRVIKRTKHK